MGLALAFFASIIFFVFAVYVYFVHGRRPRDLSRKSKDFLETTPARQLAPRFDPIVQAGDELIVPTAHGAYPESDAGGTLWLQMLEAWIVRGAMVRYVIVGGFSPKCGAIAQLALKCPENFEVLFFAANGCEPCEANSVAEELFVTHPTVLRDSRGNLKAMWLERFHLPESGIAMDVSYISPDDIASSIVAARYYKKLELLMSASRSPRLAELETIAEAA